MSLPAFFSKFGQRAPRIGFGFLAMGAGAVALWPENLPTFSLEKLLAFAAALAVWLYAELVEAPPNHNAELRASSASAHDHSLAKRFHGIVDDNAIQFLSQHDFGGSWLKIYLDPLYEFVHLSKQATSEFDDAELQSSFAELQNTSSQLARDLALGAWPIKASGAFSMIPDLEREAEWSEITTDRIIEANKLADKVAQNFKAFYRLCRTKGINLLGSPSAPNMG